MGQAEIADRARRMAGAPISGAPRGPRLGPAAHARAGAVRDGRAGPEGHRARAAGMAAARRCRRSLRARPLRPAAGRRVCAGRRARRARRRLAARPSSSRPRAPTSSSPRWCRTRTGPHPRRSTTTDGSGGCAAARARRPRRRRRADARAAPPRRHARRDRARRRAGARAHRRALVLRYRAPADRRGRAGAFIRDHQIASVTSTSRT